MALQMKQRKSFGPQGLANVKLLNKVVRITFKDGDVYEIPSDNWDKNRPAGEYNVTLNKAGDKIVGLKPIAGTYIVRFHKFANRVDEIPQTRIQRGRHVDTADGKHFDIPDKLVFDALLEVVQQDRFEGLDILCILPYGFEPLSGTPFSTISVAGKKDLERIEQFLRFSGYNFDKDIPYAPNVLPWLEEELKRAAKMFMVTIGEKGFIDTMAEVPAALLSGLGKKKGKK